MSAQSFPPFEQEGRALLLHVAQGGVVLDVDSPDLVVGAKKPAPDVCAGAPCSQGLALRPVDCRDGTFAVDVQRERGPWSLSLSLSLSLTLSLTLTLTLTFFPHVN